MRRRRSFSSGSNLVTRQCALKTFGATTYDPVTALGADLVVYIDAEEQPEADTDSIPTLLNLGTGADFDVYSGDAARRATLQTVSGDKVIRFDGSNDIYGSASSIAAMTPDWTFYALVKETSGVNNQWVVWAGAENNSILLGYNDGKWTFYNGAQTDINDADTSAFHIVKNTNGTTAAGTWWIGAHRDALAAYFAGDAKVFMAIKRDLTGPEATALEAWLTARI